MFFNDERPHFFNPLTGKYREVVAECLRLLYQRLYTDLRDYGSGLDREGLVAIFKEAIARSPVLETRDEPGDQEGRFKTQRELAAFILNRLLEAGWLERRVDEASLQSSYGFTRMGRQFTQPFAAQQKNDFRTRHRNTRNTRNSLQAFLDRAEVHDLLDAYEYSERIISDFTDVVAELEERKRQLVREVEARQLVQQASDEFFDFMESVFKPDLEVRLSADSVEKYRDQIAQIIRRIRRKRRYGQGEPEQANRDWRAVMEIRLRELLPQHVTPGRSLLETLLQAIETRLRNACDIMLPALRKALNTFTQRADIIIRQLSYIHTQSGDNALDVCRLLAEQPEQRQAELLERHGDSWSSMQLRYLDPGQLVLRERKHRASIRSELDEDQPLDRDAQKQLHVEQALEQAFALQGKTVRDYVQRALAGRGRISSRELSATTLPELLSLARATEVGAATNLSSGFGFRVHQSPESLQAPPRETRDDCFVRRDEYIIELTGEVHEPSD